MALTAADLQKRHELEGAPDPFPSLADPPAKSRPQTVRSELDTDSQVAFPSLVSSSATPTQAASAWGAGPRLRAINKTTYTDSIAVAHSQVAAANKDGKSVVNEALKQVHGKFKVKIEASTNAKEVVFVFKADQEKDLERAKRHLLALLSPIVTLTLNAPISTISTIIGPKGVTLKGVREKTGVKIDIPQRSDVLGSANGHAPGVQTLSLEDDEEDEPTLPITISGPQTSVLEAQAHIHNIIASKISTTTKRVRQIPTHILPHILARRPAYLSLAQDATIDLRLERELREIIVTGEREATNRIVEGIKKDIEDLTASLTNLKISLPKPRHRLLVGKSVDELVTKSKCSVIVSPPDDSSEEVTVWGVGTDLPAGLAAVIERANSQHVHEFPLPGPIAVSRQLLVYLTYTSYPRKLQQEFPGALVYIPSVLAAQKASKITIDIIGEKPVVDSVVRRVSELIGKLIGATREIPIDWLLHKIISGKNSKKIKAFHEQHNIHVYFPSESEERSSVLLVYDPLSPNASPAPDEKKKHLDDVEKELVKLSKDAADVKSQKVSVEKRWHDAVIGQNGTTLNAIIGEDKALSIKVGADVGDPTEDVILVRGASKDVERAVQNILQIVENAKNDEIDNSHSTEFEIERDFVGRIVGAQGAGINKLREQLGVRVDVSGEDDKDGGKRKKSAFASRSKIKITGRKENVEEAKRRILAQVERLADETTEIIKIPSQYHSSLIGQNGKYAIRLEEKYSVKITFSRGSGDESKREQLKADEVQIKGGKKGVAHAKSELLEAYEVEKEANHTITFKVPIKSVPRILGKGGSSINEIKDNTGAQIDIEKGDDEASQTSVTIRGTKEGIKEAKAAIQAIADTVVEEITVSITIEKQYHRNLIGAGGKGLSEIITRCGGPTDLRQQAGLIRFPRPDNTDEAPDQVRLRGEAKLVKRLQIELEEVVSKLRDRVILGVEIPAAQHKSLIGRGGHHLNEFQSKFNVQVQFPGSRSYQNVGVPQNIAELTEVDPVNLVKISGSRSATQKAVEEMKSQIKAPVPEAISDTVSVPIKYWHAISQQGQLFRHLRSHGIQVDHPEAPKYVLPTPPQNLTPTARIDDDSTAIETQWEVTTHYQDYEDGTSTWMLKAKDQEALNFAQDTIASAIQRATTMSHVGFLALPDRSSFPRIVGTKGSNVARLRNETNTDVTVSKDTNIITIIGSESDINAAKAAIIKIATPGTRSPRS